MSADAEGFPDYLQPLMNRRRIGSIGTMVQIGGQVGKGGPVALGCHVQKPPLAILVGGPRVELQDAVQNSKHPLHVSVVEIDYLQVAEQSNENGAGRRGVEEMPKTGALSFKVLKDDLVAVLRRENATAVERVKKQVQFRGVVADDEMSGQPDAAQRNPGAPSHLHGHNGQGDGKTCTAIKDLVQVTVPGIVVVVGVATEAALVEQVIGKNGDLEIGCGVGRQALAHPRREHVQALEISLHVESGILIGRNKKGRPVQTDFLIGKRCQQAEFSAVTLRTQ